MVDILKGTLDEQIIKILLRKYPITVEQIAYELEIPENKIEQSLRSLEIRGILMRDILPDKVYVRLLRADIRFIGRNGTQKLSQKKKKIKNEKNIDKEKKKNMMYV